jgi:histidinol-phosphate phosphatase family protein
MEADPRQPGRHRTAEPGRLSRGGCQQPVGRRPRPVRDRHPDGDPRQDDQGLAQVGGRIDAIFFCPHTNADNCECRKPKPGLFKEIAARFNADLAGVPAVGDSLRDLQAATAVGASSRCWC